MATKRMQAPLPRDTAKVSKPTDQPAFGDNSPARKVNDTSQGISNGLETLMSDAQTNLTMVLSEFTEELRDRLTADYMQMKELDDILTEAREFEAHLQEKKEHLRHSLAAISQKLQV